MTKKYRKLKAKEALLKINQISVEYYCPYLDKNITKEVSIHDFSAADQECEICGSHGYIRIYLSTCKCGLAHDLEIQSW